MRSPVRAAVAAAAIVGAGLAGFGLTSALAQEDPTDDAPATTEAPADDARPARPEGCVGRGPGHEVLAELTGLEPEELRAAFEDGQTPAEVAEANGVSRDELVDAIVADMNEHLDQAVEDGHLTEEEADERRAEATDHAEAIADGERPEGMGHGPGGPGGPGGPRPSEDEADTPES